MKEPGRSSDEENNPTFYGGVILDYALDEDYINDYLLKQEESDMKYRRLKS